jgi:hypothetical protein
MLQTKARFSTLEDKHVFDGLNVTELHNKN